MVNVAWQQIKTDIDNGRLSPIAQIRIKSSDPMQMGQNHQVLAYGYDLNGNDLVIRIYDPNYPDDDTVTMSLNIGNPEQTTVVTESKGAQVWCFFQPLFFPGVGVPTNPYQQFSLQTGTGLHETDVTFEFGVAANGDVFAIKKSGTDSGSTEIHVLSAASGYQQFSLHTGTALHETDVTFEFRIASNRDVFAIKKSGTDSGSTEIHVLSAASEYQQFSLHTGTALHETDVTFEFGIASNRDVFAIKKSGTGSGSTETHVLRQ
ncbi:MAG: hypothetical protein LC785_02530 [Acidobacteria bacterium]|nr:hypothetical protein [Acidobacteriota bacterium]